MTKDWTGRRPPLSGCIDSGSKAPPATIQSFLLLALVTKTMEWDEIWHELSLMNQGYPDAAIQAVLDSPAHQARILSEFERVSESPTEMSVSGAG